MDIIEALRDDLPDMAPLLATSEGRRLLTRHDPLLFARVYFPHHLKNPVNGSMTVCDFHMDLIDYAMTWAEPVGKAKAHRHCFIAPRSSGKSTWIFLLMPMWAGAHGHRQFVAAFSDSEAQAITHLHSFKMELQANDLLRQDYPDFCTPKKVGSSSKEMLNNRNQIQQANGFIFMAKGADSAALGMKVGEKRPDVLLFDDIEPGESNYSDNEARKRKETLISDLFPLNSWAVVGIVGTTTMPNSLIDQMRKVKLAEEEYEGDVDLFRESLDPEQRWVLDENITVHYWPVILTDPETGTERSLWPEQWDMDYIERERGTRTFQKNLMNRPVSLDGTMWSEDDIDIDRPEFYRRTIVSVDPAVTTAKRSDYTGIAVISLGSDNKIYVRYAEQFKVSTDVLADKVAGIVGEYDASHLVVETNQGGDLWKGVFKDIPVRYKGIRAKNKKEVRAAEAADLYKRGKVKHTAHFHIAEEQMLAFPHVIHDDVVDAIVTGVLAFSKARQGIKVTTTKYMEV